MLPTCPFAFSSDSHANDSNVLSLSPDFVACVTLPVTFKFLPVLAIIVSVNPIYFSWTSQGFCAGFIFRVSGYVSCLILTPDAPALFVLCLLKHFIK